MARKRTTAAASSPDDDFNFGPKKKRTRKPTAGSNGFSSLVNDAISRIITKTGRTPTKYQAAVYAWLLEGKGHAVVNAVAGSGKTSTLIDSCIAVTDGSRRPNILMLAFNRSIAEELTARIPLNNVTAKTLNSLGAGIIYKNSREKPTLNDDKTTMVAKGIVGYDQLSRDREIDFNLMMPAVRRLVALFKGFGYGVMRDLPCKADALELADRYDIELDIDFANRKIDVDELLELTFRTYRDGLNNMRVIDYNDQLFMPLYHNMPFPTYYDFVYVDESQDLNPVQVEMVRRLTARGARAVFVGDRNQAIYGFRGADPECIDTVVRDFKATELPLSICWRCPKNVIAEAQTIVPHIEAAPTARDGKVETIKEDNMYSLVSDGDYVIGRTCAPLVEICLTLIRSGMKAVVRGSDIGKNLCSLADKIDRDKIKADDSGHVDVGNRVWAKIETWGLRETAKLNNPGQESKAARLQDRVDTLLVLAEGCNDFKELKDKITSIFSDTVRGVLLSTIHRVKGLEAERVFVVHPELLPHPMAKKAWARKQESNLEYVAITRATSELYWVQMKERKKNGGEV